MDNSYGIQSLLSGEESVSVEVARETVWNILLCWLVTSSLQIMLGGTITFRFGIEWWRNIGAGVGVFLRQIA